MVNMLVYMIRKREKTLDDIKRDMPKMISSQVVTQVKIQQAQLGDDFYLA